MTENTDLFWEFTWRTTPHFLPGQSNLSPGAGMECDALQGRLLFIRLQTIYAAENERIINALATVSLEEVHYIGQCIQKDLILKILRATVNTHFPRELALMAMRTIESPDELSKRQSLLFGAWKYVSLAETAFETMRFMEGNDPEECLQELSEISKQLYSALIIAADACRRLGRGNEAELYIRQAEISTLD